MKIAFLLLGFGLCQRRRTTSIVSTTTVAPISTSTIATTTETIPTETIVPTTNQSDTISRGTIDGGKIALVAGIAGGIIFILALGSFLYYHTKREKKINSVAIDLPNQKEEEEEVIPAVATYEIEVEVPAEVPDNVSGSTFTGQEYLQPPMAYDRRPSNISQVSHTPSQGYYYEPYQQYGPDYYQGYGGYYYDPNYTQPNQYYQQPLYTVEPMAPVQLSQGLPQPQPPQEILPSKENNFNTL
jgi:hypothetical protein